MTSMVEGHTSFGREQRKRHHSMAHGKAKKMTNASNGKTGVWSEEEDRLLAEWQKKVGNKWSEVAKHIDGKSGQQCAQRWRHRVNPAIKRDKWDAREDELLTNLVAKHGNSWAEIARHVPGRTDQQCMGRWKRHLDPSIRREKWSDEEDVTLCALFSKYNNAWSTISKALYGRTPQQCRTRWHNLKTSSFMVRRKEDIQKVDMEAVEALLVQQQCSFPAAIDIALGVQKEEIEVVGYQKKKKRGRPAKSGSRDTTSEPRERRRRRTVVSWHEEARSLPFLECMQASQHRRCRSTRPQRRLCFDSILHILQTLSLPDGVAGWGQCGGRVAQPWKARQKDAKHDGSFRNNQWWEECGDDDADIMLPINRTNMMVCVSPFPNRHGNEYVAANHMTPPKPKSKREVLGSQRAPSPLRPKCAMDSGESFLGIEDLMGSKTPLSALRHAPKSGFSPALADLLKSPLINHDMSHGKSIGFHGFGSPSPHYGRVGQAWDSGRETPNRGLSDVVRCLDTDIEFACDSMQSRNVTRNDVLAKENGAHLDNAPLYTPSGMAVPFHQIVDSTPKMASGSVMMKGHHHELSAGESIPTRYVAVETDHGAAAKLLPVRLLPSSQTSEQVHLSIGDDKPTGAVYNNAREVPGNSGHQQDTLKRRARRLSSASVRMSLHTLLEKV